MAKKILIIDDNPEFVEATTNLLDARGYQVDSAENGKVGIEKAKKNKPDLILLDVMMTTKSEGFDVAREMHNEPSLKGTPVIMITGVRKEMNLPFGFEPDADWLPVKEVLEKPVKPDVLLAAVTKALR
ncbi:MAG: response regulator [Phycisphaerae bacterium]|nr:response regulator [Phycisphaerae bacterium]